MWGGNTGRPAGPVCHQQNGAPFEEPVDSPDRRLDDSFLGLDIAAGGHYLPRAERRAAFPIPNLSLGPDNRGRKNLITGACRVLVKQTKRSRDGFNIQTRCQTSKMPLQSLKVQWQTRPVSSEIRPNRPGPCDRPIAPDRRQPRNPPELEKGSPTSRLCLSAIYFYPN